MSGRRQAETCIRASKGTILLFQDPGVWFSAMQKSLFQMQGDSKGCPNYSASTLACPRNAEAQDPANKIPNPLPREPVKVPAALGCVCVCVRVCIYIHIYVYMCVYL